VADSCRKFFAHQTASDHGDSTSIDANSRLLNVSKKKFLAVGLTMGATFQSNDFPMSLPDQFPALIINQPKR
jgi:hypothetical protein